MDGFRVLEIKKSVFESNDREADLVREQLKRDRTFLLNLMSSPGSGKTTTLKATIAALKDDYNALLAAIRNAGLMESAPPN